MMLMHPLHPPHHGKPISGFSCPASFRRGFERPAANSQLPEIFEELGDGGDKVYVAVGKSVEKGVSLIQWSVKQFGGREICVLHVHQPSQFIPTLLGKLPASQANDEVVSTYRKEEKEQKIKLLQQYLSICSGAKVKASIAMIEADEVEKGIVDLVNRHGVTKLIMGAVPEKLKKRSSKAHYAANNAPLFCEIWFINKGKPLWTRDALGDQSSLPSCSQLQIASAEMSRPDSFQHRKNKEFDPECLQSNFTKITDSFRINNLVQSGPVWAGVPASSPTISCSTNTCLPHKFHSSTSTSVSSSSGYSSAGGRVFSDSDLHITLTEAEASADTALVEVLSCKRSESEAMEAVNQVKAYELALRATLEDQEKVLEEREQITRDLQRTMRNVALLDSRVQEANRRFEEASGEEKQIQTSIATLREEIQSIKRQKMEALRWLERWKSHRQAGAAHCNGLIGSIEELPKLAEFSLTDLQTATCDFSKSFKIGEGGHGCVYKGEMLGRTVAIRKLHPHNMQGQSEFQQEVRVLCKIQHPHLVTLLGVCPEAWSLVYEYLPNGSLHDHLFRVHGFRKSTVSSMTWKTRVRIIAEISSALCFLHSSKPDKIVHGDLKPQNIFFDSELRCKICDFGICRLITEDNLYSGSFRRGTEPKGAFSYTDPELQRIGVLTPKSDIYSFGLIILQLVTRRAPVGLVGEVRRAVLSGNLAAILDFSAGEWPMSVAKRLVELGLQCCELNSRERPDLTPALVREFKQLHVSDKRQVPSFFLCPIRQEIMHDPQVAADGFTYEGEALHKWLQNGGETSPMTNLKLSHLHLTPNHALRLAIQDWLCKS